MKTLTAIATLCLGLAAPAFAADGPLPPDVAAEAVCAHCGVWDLVGSEPAGAAGERIVVGPGFVTLPACGTFRIDEVDTVTLSEDAAPRRVHAVLRLRPQGPDGGCAAAEDGRVRLEITVTGTLRGHGTAEFGVFRDASDAPRLTATGRAAATMPPVALRARAPAIDAADPVPAPPDRLGRGL